MSALPILQANINHSAGAQDLLAQTLAEWGIKVAVVAEPYYVPTRDDWVGDREGLVAIAAPAAAGAPPIDRVSRGRGYVLAAVGGVTIIGVYCPPSRVLADFEQMLVEVGALVGQVAPSPVLVAGDFNAKSTAWGSPVTDARGECLQEWAVSTGLAVLNTGTEDTCVRQQGGSIVDITLASTALARRVQGWRVVVGVETLSDHRYIRFDVSALPTGSQGSARFPTVGGGPRWVLGRLDREVAREAAIIEDWASGSDIGQDVDEEAGRLGASLGRICDAAMPRARPLPPRHRVYWWNDGLRRMRVACGRARRRYTRCRRRRLRDAQEESASYAAYRALRDEFRLAITRAKEAAWEEWLRTLDGDPWGRPYKVVRKKLRPWAPPVTSSVDGDFLGVVVDALFPQRDEWVPPAMARQDPRSAGDDDLPAPPVSEAEFGAAVLRLKMKRTAPGPDGVPGTALAIALEEIGGRVRSLFTACVAQGRFPRLWKTGKLVLLPKVGRPAGLPSSYRPIVLLDEVSKLFERVLAARLAECMDPDLDDAQFGFRRGRSTLDAVARVRDLAEEAVSQGGVMLAVSLDIRNAFNALPWETVRAALRYHGVPQYLQRVIADYFAGRAVVYPTRAGEGRREMSCGVPQGSVLGPPLWNIGYDWVLRGATLRGVGVTCYADDTLVSARGSTYREASLLATAAVAQVVGRIRALGLEVALEKSEALVFYGPRNRPPPEASIIVGGTSIAVGTTMKYLGLVLDGRWKFEEHFRRLAPKLLATAGALGRILPNVGGPGGACRRLYTGVVRSMALYGAPIWAGAMSSRNLAALRRPQRAMALRVARAYRTVSCVGACVLAGAPPWDLDAEVLAAVYWRIKEAIAGGGRPHPREIRHWREEGRETLLRRWAARLETPDASVEVVAAVRPILREWLERRHGALSFHLTQMITGHGCFGRYLCRVAGREPTEMCHHCVAGVADTAQHTREECPAWAVPRAALSAAIGIDLSLPALVKAMVDSDESWQAVAAFANEVMVRKEAAERDREDDVDSAPMRRRRLGRRRRAFAGQMPP